jgi:hypothetical protein
VGLAFLKICHVQLVKPVVKTAKNYYMMIKAANSRNNEKVAIVCTIMMY